MSTFLAPAAPQGGGEADDLKVDPSFLGRGWSFPPTFDAGLNIVQLVDDATDVRQSLWILLSTGLGERVMLPGYGCDLASKIFMPLTSTRATEIAEMVRRAIVEWEPRVFVDDVTVAHGTLEGWIEISVRYLIRQTNRFDNLVFPFCSEEATASPPPA